MEGAMKLKRWVVVLAMLLALGCGEEKKPAEESDARDVELGDNLNATPAASEAGKRDTGSGPDEKYCRQEAEKICAVFSKRNTPPFTPEQIAKCVARKTIEYCKEG
jgi:hypothetical protein